MKRAFMQTGITGLDAILGGGIPRGNVVLITGGPGSGKTSLGVEFVYRGAREFNEPGMIVTFEVSTDRLIEDASSLGWDLEDLQNRGRVKIISTSPSVFRQEVQHEDSLLLSEARAIGARRIFIDGLAGMATNGESMPTHMGAGQIFRMLIEGLYRDGTTAMFTLDAPAETAARGHLSEEFIADTIVRLGLDLVNRHAHRSLEIVKSRGHNYLMGSHSFKIVDQQGLVVYPRVQMPRVRRVDSAALGDLTARITTGVEGLDGLLNGGYYVGSTTLVVGISGTGKSVMGLQFMAEGARRGERSLMVTLDEPMAHVIRNAATIGIDLPAEIERGMVHLWSESPQEMEIDEHFAQLEGIVETFQPQRVLIDSMSSYTGTVTSKEEFRDFFLAITRLMRSRGITSVHNYENPEMLGMSSMAGEFRVSSLVDNILLLNWVELGDTFRKSLTVAKARAMPTSRVTHECEIRPESGLVVLPRQIHMAVPALPFASYFGLLSRSPERRAASPDPNSGGQS
jgi:circadian clock protein KaiC